MTIRNRRWRDNKARHREAKHISRLHEDGLTRKSTPAEVFSAHLVRTSKRKGFTRRLLESYGSTEIDKSETVPVDPISRIIMPMMPTPDYKKLTKLAA